MTTLETRIKEVIDNRVCNTAMVSVKDLEEVLELVKEPVRKLDAFDMLILRAGVSSGDEGSMSLAAQLVGVDRLTTQ